MQREENSANGDVPAGWHAGLDFTKKAKKL